MKKGYRIFTVLFVVGVMIVTGGSAMAGWTGGAGTKNVLIGASAGALSLVTTASSPVYTIGAAESLTTGDYVQIDLVGGATWGAQLSDTSISLATTGSATLSYLSGGAIGATTVKYRVGGTGTISSPSAITFNYGTVALFDVSKLNSGSNVDVVLSLVNSAGGVIVTRSLYATPFPYPFVGASLFKVANTPSSDFADVGALTGAYTKFENNLTQGSKGVLTLSVPTLGVPAAGPSAKKVLITLTGDFKGISSIKTDAPFTGSDRTGSTTSGLAGYFLINADMTEACAVNSGVIVAGDITVAPVFFIDGTTVQNERSFTAKVENFVDTSYAATTWLNPSKCYEIKRNGVFFSANSLGGYNTIKISDTNGKIPTSGAKVLISAWDTAGVKLAEVSGSAEILLMANQTITLTGDQIAARFVGSAMKYEVAVQSTSALITNVKKTPDGFGSTVYKGGGGGGL